MCKPILVIGLARCKLQADQLSVSSSCMGCSDKVLYNPELLHHCSVVSYTTPSNTLANNCQAVVKENKTRIIPSQASQLQKITSG